MTYVPDLIRVKRDGGELSEEQVRELVAGVADGAVSDAQVGALAMAIVLNGMTAAERIALTGAMRDSGDVLDWSDAGLPGPAFAPLLTVPTPPMSATYCRPSRR